MAAKVERGSTLPSTCNLVNASHRSTIQSLQWHMQRIKKSHSTQKTGIQKFIKIMPLRQMHSKSKTQMYQRTGPQNEHIKLLPLQMACLTSSVDV